MFKNRTEAAILLAAKLAKYKDKDGIVLAIPRGGVPIGCIIAEAINFAFEIVLAKKIGHPKNQEFAIGSVSLNGIFIDKNCKDVSLHYIQHEAARLSEALKEKYTSFMGNKKPSDLTNKTVIIVDDGIATGHTISATIDSVKKSGANEIIVAVPVAPYKTSARISKLVNEFVCLLVPEKFQSVGRFYTDFSEVTDEEVIRLIQNSKTKKE